MLEIRQSYGHLRKLYTIAILNFTQYSNLGWLLLSGGHCVFDQSVVTKQTKPKMWQEAFGSAARISGVDDQTSCSIFFSPLHKKYKKNPGSLLTTSASFNCRNCLCKQVKRFRYSGVFHKPLKPAPGGTQSESPVLCTQVLSPLQKLANSERC